MVTGTYRYARDDARTLSYHFGDGLSYTEFSFSAPTLLVDGAPAVSSSAQPCQNFSVSVTVTNTGKRPGSHFAGNLSARLLVVRRPLCDTDYLWLQVRWFSSTSRAKTQQRWRQHTLPQVSEPQHRFTLMISHCFILILTISVTFLSTQLTCEHWRASPGRTSSPPERVKS